MELWQIASLMGPEDGASTPSSPYASTPPSQSDSLLRERVRRSKEGLPEIGEDELEAYDDAAVYGMQQEMFRSGE